MALLKKMDSYLLKTFLGLFAMTFLICVFILLMQFLWMHVNDLVGKGVEVPVLAEFFIYAAASVIPLALPLAILLASLMTFGNLGEHFELTAMKAAGVSLFRIMRPLSIAIAFVCVGAFYFSNNILPRSQTKLWALIFSLRQKSPELDIPVGEFYDGIDGYNIYVSGKNPQTGMLYDMKIYDLSKGFKDAAVIVADSGHIYFTADNKFLLLRLYNGESFENLDQQQQRATSSKQRIPFRRETFYEKQILIDFDTEFNRYDESVLADQHVSKDVSGLIQSIDSVENIASQRSAEQSKSIVSTKYFGREQVSNRDLPDLLADEVDKYDIDSLYASLTPTAKERAVGKAIEKAQQMRDVVEYNSITLDDSQRYIRRHEIELHRKFTLAFACLIFFFIGAPLGAIIRKGGMGAPIVISVVMFIIYYIIDNTGYKMAREALWPVTPGMWLSSSILLPIGIFLTWKAATDSALLNPEAWLKQWDKVKRLYIKIKVYIKHKYNR